MRFPSNCILTDWTGGDTSVQKYSSRRQTDGRTDGRRACVGRRLIAKEHLGQKQQLYRTGVGGPSN